jgi:phosphatidylserine/phosphatidylglycerophosphate/cardiolipin synthase-like enzyme
VRRSTSLVFGARRALAACALVVLIASVPVATGVGAGPAAAGAGAGLHGVVVEPQDGLAPIYRFILGARHSLDMTMYELVDPAAERDLGKDAARGVRVRVILDQNRERSRNTPAYRYLVAHHVKVVWADPSYDATHEKCVVVDGREALVMTMNLDAEYYATTRDFAVFDTDRADVTAIESVFGADFAHRPVVPSKGTDLVWSPGSLPALLAVIHGARRTLSIENEEMSSPDITRALVAAAKRGVRVRIAMVADSYYDRAFDQIVAAGGRVHLYPYSWTGLYIHAKVTVADAGERDQRLYLGSINFSDASLFYNRELGIVSGNAAVVAAVNAVVARDYAGGSNYAG